MKSFFLIVGVLILLLIIDVFILDLEISVYGIRPFLELEAETGIVRINVDTCQKHLNMHKSKGN
jgi:hypothetical protein